MAIRQDQIERLGDLAERLADQVLMDADPANWSGAGMLPQDMDKETRGNAAWDRKMATSSMSILVKAVQLSQSLAGTGGPLPPGHDYDEEIKKAEREAARLVDQHLKRHAENDA